MAAWLRWTMRGLLSIVLLVAAGTFVPRPFVSSGTGAAGDKGVRILVLSNPIHTDIAIPLNDQTRAAFGFLADFGIPVDDIGARWLVIGWGGRSFYLETPTWADLKPMPVFRALTVDRSVMHVDIAGPIDERQGFVRTLDLSSSGFLDLSDFILAGFARQGGAVVVIPDAGYGPYDRFFEANGWFNALVGCNTWTAAALRAAGLRTGFWDPLPPMLDMSLRLFN